MRLVFLRHGKAAGSNFPGADADRPLTEEGWQQAAAAAAALARQGVRLDRLFASPLRRARETAQALIDAGLASGIDLCPELLPEHGSERLVSLIAALPYEGTYAFVGHEPMLSEVVEKLLFNAARGSLVLGKGSLCVLRREESGWQLEALVPSSWFFQLRV